MGSREPGSSVDLRLDPEGREGAKVSSANEEGCPRTRFQGARISLERMVLSLGLRTTPISRKPSLPDFSLPCSC